MPLLSIVSTLYKSAPHIEEFHRRISEEAKKITGDYEIIMVDDGSPDDSLAIALSLLDVDPKLSIVELSRNFGHHKAMMTGLEHAEGDLVFLIDVDLEEPPELMTRFYEEIQKGGWDVVYGAQKERKGGIVKRVGGALGWWFVNAMLPIRVPRNQSTVRLMTKQYVNELVRHKEHMTAIGGLWIITGFRQTGLFFDKFCQGQSSYTFLKRARVLLDSITSFSEIPLYGVFFLGGGIFILSSILAAYLIAQRLLGVVMEGWVSVMVSVWLLGGMAIFCVGVVGLYVSRIFIETKSRPYTIVRDIYSGSKETNTLS